MYRFGIWLGILIIASVLTVKAQEQSFKTVEDSLALLTAKIYSDASISDREVANAYFIKLLKNNLIKAKAFDYPFDSLKHIGKIKAEDGRLRVFSWNFPYSDGTQKYFGFILLKNKKGELSLIELTDNRKAIVNPIKDILKPNSWMGALYYSIIDVKSKESKYYILLGLDFNNLFSSKKIIEVLTVGENNEISFGSDVFKVGNETLNRVVFEFSSRATMMLRYIPESKNIVFDHLSPSRPDYADNFQFYGPDFSHDGFKFEKGKWVYVRNLDLRNPNREPAKPRESDEKFIQPGFIYKGKSGLPMVIKN